MPFLSYLYDGDSELDVGSLTETPVRSPLAAQELSVLLKQEAESRCGYTVRREFIYTLGGECQQLVKKSTPSLMCSNSIGLKTPNVSWHGSRSVDNRSRRVENLIAAQDRPLRIQSLEALLEVKYGYSYPSVASWDRYEIEMKKDSKLSDVTRAKALLWRGLSGVTKSHTRAGAWEVCLHGQIKDVSRRWVRNCAEPLNDGVSLLPHRMEYWNIVETEYSDILTLNAMESEDKPSTGKGSGYICSDILTLNAMESEDKPSTEKGGTYWRKRELQQIRLDLRRTTVDGMPCINQLYCQGMMERILWVWSVTHQDCGYVQGQNDILLYFVIVYLSAICDLTSEEEIENLDITLANTVEADLFRAFGTVIHQIRDNFDPGLEGVHRMTRQLRDLAVRIDPQLVIHLDQHDVSFIQFSVRWIINLLARELPLCCVLRLWDTYLAQGVEQLSKFHIFVCAIFLAHWSSALQKLGDFQSIILFIQDLPTELWKVEDMDMLLSEAFVLQKLYGDSPSHWMSDYNEDL